MRLWIFWSVLQVVKLNFAFAVRSAISSSIASKMRADSRSLKVSVLLLDGSFWMFMAL